MTNLHMDHFVQYKCDDRTQIKFTFLSILKIIYRSPISLSHREFVVLQSVNSVTQSLPTLCDPMNLSTPGLPVHHHPLEFTQTPVHRVSDAIQPSHPLSFPFSSCPQSLPASESSNESTLRMRWPKYWSFSFTSFLPKNTQD